MESERSWIGLATVGGRMYAIGGMNGPLGDRLDSNEVYDPRTNEWHYLSPMPTARSSPGTVGVGSQIYVLGGYPASGVTTVVEAYDTVRDVWRTGLSPMPTKRFDLAAVAVDQLIYTFGGYDVGPMNVVEEYDTANDRWQALTPMPTARYALQAVVVDGKIWVMGGHTAEGPTNIIEVFDPATQRWSAGQRLLPDALAGFGAALGGGKLHIAKFDVHYALDIVTGQWSRLPPMLTSRHGLQLAYIDQYLFAVGGCMPGDSNLFDVAKNEAYVSTERSPHPVEREGPGVMVVLAVVVAVAALLMPRLGAHG
jgi:N-acetylneuraminic acid mutarotase